MATSTGKNTESRCPARTEGSGPATAFLGELLPGVVRFDSLLDTIARIPSMPISSDPLGRAVPFDGRLQPPRFASIETTMYCNLTCHFCALYENGTTVKGPHMSREAFEAVSDKLFPHIHVLQPSVAGEPLMSKSLDRVLEKAARMGIRVEYFTNATLMTPRRIELMLETAGRIFISFDSARKETYERLRRGAKFDQVVSNLRNLMTAVRALPDEHRPVVGFALVLMSHNVTDLKLLIDLAVELGLDCVAGTHVIPNVKKVQEESLVHQVDRARILLGEAAEYAVQRGMPFRVNALDQLTATLALADDLSMTHARPVSDSDGHVEGLGAIEVLPERIRPFPVAPPATADPSIVARKALSRASNELASNSELPESIWTCDFLWERLYVDHEGNAVPCCMPGGPFLGNLVRDELEAVWNGREEREMRMAMARKDPVPFCKGCLHIKEVREPDQIARLLNGCSLPRAQGPLSPRLRPVVHDANLPDAELVEHGDAPVLEWNDVPDCEGYEVEISLDGFQTIVFTTPWLGIEIHEPRYAIPLWAWEEMAADHVASWRVLAIFTRERSVIAQGACRRVI